MLECPTRNDTTDCSLIPNKMDLEVNVYTSWKKGCVFVSILEQLSLFKWDFCKKKYPDHAHCSIDM